MQARAGTDPIDWLDLDEHDRFCREMQMVDSIRELAGRFPNLSLGEVIALTKRLGVYDWLVLGDRGPIGDVARRSP